MGVIAPGGCMLVAEAFYCTHDVDPELIEFEGELHTEMELLQIIEDENALLTNVVHSDRDDWDRYVSSNAVRDVAWLRANPHHPDRQGRIDGHANWWKMYLKHRLPLQRCAAFLMTCL